MRNAILLSGGMDSTALAAWKRPQIAFTIDYGQRAAAGEIRAAQEITRALSMDHHIITVDCSSLGAGDMSNHPVSEIAPVSEWWPYRNQLLVTLAAMKAISLDVETLMIGSVAGDSQHVDGSEAFYHLLDKLIALQEGSLRITAPAIAMTTVQLVLVSKLPTTILGWCHSCHKHEFACGRCRGCHKHSQTMSELGFGDTLQLF